MRKWFIGSLTMFAVLATSATPLAAAAASPLLAPVSARTVTVTVIGQQGQPVADAVVQLLTPGAAAFSLLRTNDKGLVTLALPDGFSFWLRVWADGYGLVERPYVPASDGPVVTVNASAYRATLTGLVTDDRGQAVSGAKVTAWLADMGLQATATTDARGFYSLEGLVARTGYTLQVEARTFAPFVQTDITLASGAREQVDTVLSPVAGAVTGEVIDSRTLEPVSGVKVELILNGWGVLAETTTDVFGYFQVNAPAGEDSAYQVRLSQGAYETYTSAAFAAAAGSWTDFSGSDRITLNPLYAELSGSVLGSSGNPLAKAPVQLQRSGLGTVETGETDSNGYYTFSNIPAGTYRVRALPTDDQEAGASEWVTLAGGDRVTADVSANTPDKTSFGSSAIVGTVRDHRGNPVAGATVAATRGSSKVSAETDNQGRYRLSVDANVEDTFDEPDTSSGYHVSVTRDGYLPNDQQGTADDAPSPTFVNVRYKATNRADFTLQPANATLSGRVMNDQGRPVAGAPVLLVQEGMGEVTRTTTNSLGQYRFTMLPVAKQARYTPVVASPDYFVSTIGTDGAPLAPTSLQPGSATTLTLTVQPSVARVQGVIQAGAEKPGAGAEVTLIRPADGRTFTGKAAADGAYSIAVETGPGRQYLLRASLPGTTTASTAGSIDLADNQGVTANASVVPLAAISGRVYQPDGRPAAGEDVYLFTEGGLKNLQVATTDSQGYYRFDNVAPGRRYSVTLHAGVNVWSSLAPGEAILTPLLAPAPGQTLWADLVSPYSEGVLPGAEQ